MSLFSTITSDDWKRAIKRGRTEPNAVALGIRASLRDRSIQTATGSVDAIRVGLEGGGNLVKLGLGRTAPGGGGGQLGSSSVNRGSEGEGRSGGGVEGRADGVKGSHEESELVIGYTERVPRYGHKGPELAVDGSAKDGVAQNANQDEVNQAATSPSAEGGTVLVDREDKGDEIDNPKQEAEVHSDEDAQFTD